MLFYKHFPSILNPVSSFPKGAPSSSIFFPQIILSALSDNSNVKTCWLSSSKDRFLGWFFFRNYAQMTAFSYFETPWNYIFTNRELNSASCGRFFLKFLTGWPVMADFRSVQISKLSQSGSNSLCRLIRTPGVRIWYQILSMTSLWLI